MMKRIIWPTLLGCAVAVLAGCPAPDARAQDGASVLKMITSAKPGSVVTLPEGVFDIGSIAVPPGVSVIGAGYQKTILNAKGADSGLVIRNSRQAAVSDLTVQNATGAGILVDASTDITIQRVRAMGNSLGVVISGSTNVLVQNAVAGNNRTGFVMMNCVKPALVNCTAGHNDSLSVNLAACRDGAVFNNLFVGSQTGISATKDNANLALDRNNYVALHTGGLVGEAIRESLPAWRTLSGYDRHSTELRVDFADAKAGLFRPTNALPWALDRSPASGWGVRELAGIQAPEKDMDGNRRRDPPSLGAYEVTLTPARPADGRLAVQSGEGVTSAGLYSKEGRKLASLFDNLPLRKGNYDFWLPNGTNAGIRPGSYEVRVAEASLDLRYVGLVGGLGDSSEMDAPSIDPSLVIFDRQDHPVLFQGGNEDLTHARAFDADFVHGLWRVAGTGGAVGACIDDEGKLFYLRRDGMLFAVEAATGAPVDIDKGSFRKSISGVFSNAQGMAAMKGTLYVADSGHNKIFHTGVRELTFAASFDVPGPGWPAADMPRNLLWVISHEPAGAAGRLLALDPASGAVKHQSTAVTAPVGLAINNGRMAVSSAATRRVHLFDCTDPEHLKPIGVIGHEQKPGETNWGPLQLDCLTSGPVALNSRGDVVVLDGSNWTFFKGDGTVLRAPMPFWGQLISTGWLLDPAGKPVFAVDGMGSRGVLFLDFPSRTWKPGYRFRLPEGMDGAPMTYFHEGAWNYGVWGNNTTDARGGFTIVRFGKDGVGKSILAYRYDTAASAFVAATDANGDGTIATNEPAQALKAPDGKPVTAVRFARDGRLIAGGAVIPRAANAGGMLTYDWSKYNAASKLGLGGGGQGCFNGDFLSDGGWVTDAGGGRGFGGGFTALAALDPAGNPRWTFPVDYHCTVGSFRSVRVLPGLVLGTATEEVDTFFCDHDGLGLGVVGPIPAMKWLGYWHDQDWSLSAFDGGDGRAYMLLGDYTRHGVHWMEITGTDTIRHGKVAINVDETKAQVLASAAPVPAVHAPKPPTPQVLIRRLPKAIPIDGECQKWRDLGIAPQILVASPGVRPDDCSALVRMAWEGDNLYVQVLKFDNVVTMHQPLNFFYKQDAFELALVGGFMGGYKFGIARTTDKGDVIYREQFLMKKELLLDPAKAPRVIKVLDNAKDIAERKLIESSYGVDLSQTRVMVLEFMIPMSYAWDGKAPVEMKSGTGFWMGMFVDDNDSPGLDEQKAYAWPVTFAAFGNPDQGAWATLE